jgi:nucleoside-diphosphate-sugar epimerase
LCDCYVDAITYNKKPEHFNLFKNISFRAGNLIDVNFLSTLDNYDIILHGANYGQPGKFMENKIETILLNTYTTNFLINKLNKNGKFLFISSSEVYSGLEKESYNENDIGMTNALHDRACYIESKKCGEAICTSHNKDYNTDIKCIRLALGYGPGAKIGDRRVLYSFIEKALKYNKIEMLDSGDALRAYCYINDAVLMMFNILFNGKDVIYNVGGIDDISIYDLAAKIGKILSVPVISGNSTGLLSAPKNVKLDLSKYFKEFGQINFISYETGLKNTCRWYQ